MMENQNRKINLDPLYNFLTKVTSPEDFAELLDKFIFDYMAMLVRIQLSDEDDKTIHENTDEFLFYFKTLRDILPLCNEMGETTISK